MLSGAPEIRPDQQAHPAPPLPCAPASSVIPTLPGKRLLPAGVCQRAFASERLPRIFHRQPLS